MCRKCLWLADNEHGVDWAPVHVGTGIKTGVNFGTPKRQPNLNNIRFGEHDKEMPGWKRRPSYSKDERIEFEEGKEYTTRELERLADQMLRDDARSVDPETGKERGIGGENPILFDEHLYQRQKREILNENGVPEPGLVSGMYYRTHPEGRKVNSEEQRKRNGASFYR